ncbi:MAG: trypsin-like peptidase domain-containing protein [Chloroflexota bacterium]|nr:trypsin-like peptidase domain-containing protein [Chloroflexota bacterium]
MISIFEQLNIELGGVVADVQKSVVHVLNDRGGAGAGTIWHADGLIVTNAHVIRGGTPRVRLPNGDIVEAQVIARDDMHDLAALAVEANGLPIIQPGSARNLQPGAWVFAIGHPWGVANAVTGGIIVGANKPLPELPQSGREWVLVDLKLRPGNSGGPLVDTLGRMIGVNTIMTGLASGAAVSVDAAKDFLRRTLGSNVTSTVLKDEAPEYV